MRPATAPSSTIRQIDGISRAAPRRSRAARLGIALASIALHACGDADLEPAGAFRHRGVIEGFYGCPYTTAERVRIVRFIGERGMNVYVYAPKNDPKHRDQWRTPYTSEEIAGFAELARAADAAGVRITFAISPGGTYDDADPSDFELLAAKLRAVHEAGVRGFALLFDDIFDATADVLQHPELQARITARVAALVAGFGDGSDLWFIGQLYAGTAEQFRDATIDPRIFLYPRPPLEYYDAYAAIVPREVPILWTGPEVISRALRLDEAAGFRDLARRPVVVWDNYPANDVLGADVFLGPYTGRDADLDAAVDGIVMNMMNQPTATLVAVATGAAYMRDPSGYDPEHAWRDAIGAIGGPDAATLEGFAALHRGHPFLDGAIEAPELAARIAEAFAPDAGAVERSRLRDLLQRVSTLDTAIRSFADRALADELAPWAAKAAALGRASLLGLDALDGRAAAGAYRTARDAALLLPQHVAKDEVSPAIEAISGRANHVDRFGDLFAAIDRRIEP